ncbi:MAG: hypothetical protein ACMUIM_10640, partial [bacterium]
FAKYLYSFIVKAIVKYDRSIDHIQLTKFCNNLMKYFDLFNHCFIWPGSLKEPIIYFTNTFEQAGVGLHSTGEPMNSFKL